MFMKPVYTCIALLCVLTAHAQQRLQSKLTDSATGKPVSFATIALYRQQQPEKALQQVISKEDGSFLLNIKDTGSYELGVVHTAYKELRMPVSSGFPAALLLTPAENNVGAVQVTGVRKVLVEKNDDKLVYNVDADVSAEGQMAIDVLRKTPFVSVDGDGNIQLKGQSNYKILLNGKESGIFSKDPKEALKSLPASAIKKIEVITTPSAKYDAEGVAGIINIITTKKVAGYNASIGSFYNSMNNFNENASLNVKYGKIGFTGYFGMGGGRNNNVQTHSVTTSLVPDAYAQRTLDGIFANRYRWQYGTTELSYDLDSLNTLSAYANFGNNNGNNNRQRLVAVISADWADTSRSRLSDKNQWRYPWNDIGMDYIHKFRGNTEKEWSVKLNQQFSRDNSYAVSDQYSDISDRFVVNDNQSRNRQITVQTDLVLPLKRKQKLELGAKGIFRNAAADYESMYRLSVSDKYIPDPGNTDHFHYSQDIVAGYFTYRFPVKKWDVKIGSRLEHTKVKGVFETSGQELEQDYYNFIPSVYISRKLKEKHDLSFSYSKRLRRPYIWDLNPFVNNTDTLNISYGNPHLKPEVTHSLEIGYSYFKNSNSINIRLSQNFSNTQIIQYTLFDNTTGIAATVPYNVGENRFTALNTSMNLKLWKIWSLSVNAGVQYNFIRNRNNPSQKNSGLSGNGNLSNTFDLTKKLSFFNSAGFWQSPIQLQGKYPFNYWYDAGLTYKLLKNQLRISLRAGNFLQHYFNFKREFHDKNFVQTTTNSFVLRNIGLNVKWNFGKLSENTSRKRGVTTDDIKK